MFLLDPRAGAEEINVYFNTSPKIELLRPHGDAANLSLLITGAEGRPLEGGVVAIRLEAPKPGWFFSTDMPMVEGSRLSEMRLPLRQGRAVWKYQFPIRGEYRLAVEVEGGDGKLTTKEFLIQIRENNLKWLVLGGFSLVLFLGGIVAGRVFTGPVRSAMLSALFAALTSIDAGASTLGAQEPAKAAAAVSLEVEPAIVGRPSRISWSLADGVNRAKLLAALTLSITHVEDAKVVFALEKLPVAGEFSMNFHYSDGAEYRVTAIAEMQGRAPIKTEQLIFVTAVEPPMKAIFPALSFFLMLIAMGLGVGRWSNRRQRA